jgi:general secretion pathway protein D
MLFQGHALARHAKKHAHQSSTYGLLTGNAADQDQSLAARYASGNIRGTETYVDVESPIQVINEALRAPSSPTQKTNATSEVSQPSIAHQTAPLTQQEALQRLHVQGPPAPAKTKRTPQDATAEQSHDDTKITETDALEFHFENADLQNLVTQIEEFFNITFISDDNITPLAQDAKSLRGNKITFKTNDPLSREKAWDLFITFLYISGFAIAPTADQKFYKISQISAAQKSPEPTFIGVDPALLPDNDQLIRYVYFIANSTVEAIGSIINMLKSKEAPAIPLQDAKAILIIDKAYNIKKLMEIVKELDKVTMPQEMVVLKLKQVDAQRVEDLYKSLTQSEDKDFSRFFTSRKQPTSLYFPENARIIAEPRTNTLILLGPKDALKKIEDFIVKYVDVELDQPYSPLHTYQLKYADATTIANIMNNLTQFGKDTEAGKNGGVRGVDKYLKPMNFTPEVSTNKLIVKADYEDFLQVKEIIEKLDEPQPQIAIEVLILSISVQDAKQLGMQIRSRVPGPDGFFGNNVKFQTSGFWWDGIQQGIVENTEGSGVQRLLGDLIKVVTGGGNPGSTVLTLGSDKYGVWGIFKILQTLSNTQVVANPFVTTSNNTAATVKVGTTIRVNSGTVVGGDTSQVSQTDDSALLQLNITPLINSDGKIVLKVDVQLNEFGPSASITTQAEGQESETISVPTKNVRQVKTEAIVANKEVLALGGLIRNEASEVTTKVPILGDIPILGWFFKNKQTVLTKDNLLILISSQIISPEDPEGIQKANTSRLHDFDQTIKEMDRANSPHDPINKLFFGYKKGSPEQAFDDYIKNQLGYREEETHKVAKSTKRGRRPAKKRQEESQPARTLT